jgi:hypothetical protein
MIDVKQAVSIAISNLNGLYPDTELAEIMLEEVELSSDGKHWLVTIGFDRPKKYTRAAVGFFPFPVATTERVYKTITISSDQGQFVSMRMREAPKE